MRSLGILLVLLELSAPTWGQLKPVSLKCEYEENPFIDRSTPVFSWQYESAIPSQFQAGYEIIVSESLAKVDNGEGTAWKTGKVESTSSFGISYAGTTLRSSTPYYWRVRAYDQAGNVSPWSETAQFETALLAREDWKAKWISDGSVNPKDEDRYKNDPMPLFRKEFKTTKPLRGARLYISGLGYFEAYVDGKRIGDHVLDPGWTTYRKQVLYVAHDLTTSLKQGDHVLGVMLGNGWWNPLPFKIFGRWDLRDYQQTGRPRFIAQLHLTYEDGTFDIILSDESWLTTPGPVMRNNVYLGEHYDARKEVPGWNTVSKKSSAWKNATVAAPPDGEMTLQMQPPIRVTKTIKPISVTENAPDTFIVDLGQNFAGVLRLKVKGKVGQKVTLRLGEGLFKDGSINLLTTAATQIKKGGIRGGPGAPQTAWQEDSYTLKGGGIETWSPRFTFHGFRYVEVTGWPGKPTINDFEGLRMNSDLEPVGKFACSNADFNRLHDVIQWTFLSNVFSVQSDCPAREKMGYGADMVVSANAFIYNYDMRNFYRKAIRDFANDQQDDGGITELSPFTGIADKGYGGNSGPLGWQLGFPFLQKQLYEFYGDKKVIADFYGPFKKQMDFLQSKSVYNNFYWDISDHEAIDPKPEAFSASVFYLHHAMLAAEFAGILSNKEDSMKYTRLAGSIKREILSRYYNRHAGRFDNGTQSAQILALWYGLDPNNEKIFDELMKEFGRHKMHLSTGIFGTKMMFDVLRENDRNDVAYQVAAQKGFPGWLHMLANDATTLWESWDFPETVPSRNHPMFGSVDEWFYRSLLGINPLAPGFRKIQIKPQPAGDLTWARGSYKSVSGEISSSWRIEDGKFRLDVSIPANTTAEIWVAGTGAITASTGAMKIRQDGNYTVFQCGPGKSSFESGWPANDR